MKLSNPGSIIQNIHSSHINQWQVEQSFFVSEWSRYWYVEVTANYTLFLNHILKIKKLKKLNNYIRHFGQYDISGINIHLYKAVKTLTVNQRLELAKCRFCLHQCKQSYFLELTVNNNWFNIVSGSWYIYNIVLKEIGQSWVKVSLNSTNFYAQY